MGEPLPQAVVESVGVVQLLEGRLPPSEVSTYLANARETLARHDPMRERKDFLEILNQVDQLW